MPNSHVPFARFAAKLSLLLPLLAFLLFSVGRYVASGLEYNTRHNFVLIILAVAALLATSGLILGIAALFGFRQESAGIVGWSLRGLIFSLVIAICMWGALAYGINAGRAAKNATVRLNHFLLGAVT